MPRSRLGRAVVVAAAGFVALSASAALLLSLVLPVKPVQVNVRWRPDVGESQREELERRFQLVDGRVSRPNEGSAWTTWSYRLADPSRENVQALVQHPLVEDTAQLNRVLFRPAVAVDKPRQVRVLALATGLVGAALLFVGVAGGLHPRRLLARGRDILAGDRALWWSALFLALGAFVFRFLTLRDFANDHYMHLAWAQQLLLGAIPGRDFVDPGYPLTYALSAAAQWIRPGPLSEAVLTIGMLSVAAVMTFYAARAMTGSRVAAVAAALACILIQPQLYNYPKLLAPAGALWLLARYEAQPSRARLAALAGWTTASFLFRHDLGLYVAAAVSAGLLIANLNAPRTALKRMAGYVAFGVFTVLPYLVFVQWAEGLPEHVRASFEFVSGESSPRATPLPEFPFFAMFPALGWDSADSVATLFYMARLFVPAAIALLALHWRRQRPHTLATVIAAIALLALYAFVILRHPVGARIRDLAVPLTLVTVWICWNLAQVRRASTAPFGIRRVAAIAGAGLIVVAGFGSVWTLTNAGQALRETQMLGGPRRMLHEARIVLERTSTWRERFWPAGDMPEVVDYLRACTVPSDHLLVTWAAPEYYVFARRRFAAGHVWFSGFYTHRNQSTMISRLEQQRVPVVLINETLHDRFAREYGLVDTYLQRHYLPVARYRARDDSDIAIAVRADLHATSAHGANAWPCGLTNAVLR